MTILFFDVETIPSQKPGVLDEIKKTIKHPGNISKLETVAKWYEENLESAADNEWRKQSFDGLYGEIISIAWAFDDNAPDVVYRSNGGSSEKELLKHFLDDISQPVDMRGNRTAITKWVGHYITGFDLRFLWQRCVVNKVRPQIRIPYDAKPWDDIIFDTKVAWSGSGQYSGKSSLDAMCKAFGLNGKGDIDGSKIFDYWQDGKDREIASYNQDDVVKTRQIYKLLNFLP